jgi:monoamine oxidase
MGPNRRWLLKQSTQRKVSISTDEADGLVETAGAPFGRIVFAGADRDWEPYLHASIDSAARAVDETPQC